MLDIQYSGVGLDKGLGTSGRWLGFAIEILPLEDLEVIPRDPSWFLGEWDLMK